MAELEQSEDLKARADKAIAIYDSNYRSDYEERYRGKFLAINVLDGSATIGESGSEALLHANQQDPTGIFHLIRIGHPAAFEVGLAYKHGPPNRLYR